MGARNGISLLVRSHECKQGGMGFDVVHDKKVIRVFSARDYEEQGNGGAVLLISAAGNHKVPVLCVRPQVLNPAPMSAMGEVTTHYTQELEPRVNKRKSPKVRNS